jgi:hypothetical protein
MTTFGVPAWQPGAPPPGRPAPPVTVKLSVSLLRLAAAAVLLRLISSGYALGHFDDILHRAAERIGASPQDISNQRTGNLVANGVAIGGALLIGAALLVPSFWLSRGSPVARVLSCVAAGLVALLCCGGLALAIAGQSASGGSKLQSEVERLTVDETPAWVTLSALASALAPPLALAALVLLLVPPSNRFFRPPVAPSAYPYGGYYAYPAYPAQGWGSQQAPEPLSANEPPPGNEPPGPPSEHPPPG